MDMSDYGDCERSYIGYRFPQRMARRGQLHAYIANNFNPLTRELEADPIPMERMKILWAQKYDLDLSNIRIRNGESDNEYFIREVIPSDSE